MAEWPEASGHAAASDHGSPSGRRQAATRETLEELTRAQARALSRCAPLTPEEFKARRRVAEQGLISLRGLLDDAGDG